MRIFRRAVDRGHQPPATRLEMWPSSMVESVCEALADTANGLTGSEIGRLLDKVWVPDLDPSATKRYRLSYALLAQQQRQQVANCIVAFIREAMAPGLHFNNLVRHQDMQDGLNERLSLMGLKVLDDGRVASSADRNHGRRSGPDRRTAEDRACAALHPPPR